MLVQYWIKKSNNREEDRKKKKEIKPCVYDASGAMVADWCITNFYLIENEVKINLLFYS